jgi:hypothetical protein
MPAAPAAAIGEAEQALYRAMIERDFAALDRLLSPALRYVHSTGVAEGKAQYLEGVANGLYEYGSIASRDVQIRLSDNVAVSTGIVDMSVGARGEPKRMTPLLFVLVWTRKDGAWQLDYRQATRIAT